MAPRHFSPDAARRMRAQLLRRHRRRRRPQDRRSHAGRRTSACSTGPSTQPTTAPSSPSPARPPPSSNPPSAAWPGRKAHRPHPPERRPSPHRRRRRRPLRPRQRHLPRASAPLLARQAGLEIWRRFGVPVYFYEAAAARPDRVRLEDVRRGQFEGLRDAVLPRPRPPS